MASLVFLLLVSLMAIMQPLVERHITRFTVVENHPCHRYMPPGARGIPRDNFLLAPIADEASARADLNRDGQWTALELSEALAHEELAASRRRSPTKSWQPSMTTAMAPSTRQSSTRRPAP